MAAAGLSGRPTSHQARPALYSLLPLSTQGWPHTIAGTRPPIQLLPRRRWSSHSSARLLLRLHLHRLMRGLSWPLAPGSRPHHRSIAAGLAVPPGAQAGEKGGRGRGHTGHTGRRKKGGGSKQYKASRRSICHIRCCTMLHMHMPCHIRMCTAYALGGVHHNHARANPQARAAAHGTPPALRAQPHTEATRSKARHTHSARAPHSSLLLHTPLARAHLRGPLLAPGRLAHHAFATLVARAPRAAGRAVLGFAPPALCAPLPCILVLLLDQPDQRLAPASTRPRQPMLHAWGVCSKAGLCRAHGPRRAHSA